MPKLISDKDMNHIKQAAAYLLRCFAAHSTYMMSKEDILEGFFRSGDAEAVARAVKIGGLELSGPTTQKVMIPHKDDPSLLTAAFLRLTPSMAKEYFLPDYGTTEVTALPLQVRCDLVGAATSYLDFVAAVHDALMLIDWLSDNASSLKSVAVMFPAVITLYALAVEHAGLTDREKEAVAKKQDKMSATTSNYSPLRMPSGYSTAAADLSAKIMAAALMPPAPSLARQDYGGGLVVLHTNMFMSEFTFQRMAAAVYPRPCIRTNPLAKLDLSTMTPLPSDHSSQDPLTLFHY